MDTLLSCQKTKHLITIFLGTAAVMGVVFFQNSGFAANELKIAQTIVSPILENAKLQESINHEIYIKNRLKIFDDSLQNKYKKAGCNPIIKPIDVGIVHVKLTRYYQGKPVRLNIIELDKSLNPQLDIKPTLASDTLSNKTTIKKIAKKNNTLAAINGTYFKPQTGVPLGTLMINKKLYTGPIYDRVAIGFFNDKYDMARVQLKGKFSNGIDEVKIDNINQPRMLCSYVLAYTPDWSTTAPPPPKDGLQISIENGRIKTIGAQKTEIPKNGYVIVAPKGKLDNFKIGQKVELELNVMPEWVGVNHIVSGGPYLVKNGEVFVDMTAQKLQSVGGRNPRTAIGYTADNHLILVTADGREGSSIGLTLTELAYFMKTLGCINAMNLDGGGSTVMYVSGEVVNRPPVTDGIMLSNALTIIK